MLTGTAGRDGTADYRLVWWNLKTKASGSTAIPAGTAYMAAAPDGALLQSADHLEDLATDGTVTDLGAPFPGNANWSATAGDDGAVLATNDVPGQLTYHAWNGTGFTALDLQDPDRRAGCSAVVGEYAGCIDSRTGGHFRVLLVPVDGARPAQIIDQRGGIVAVVGSRVLFEHTTSRGDAFKISSVAYGSPKLEHGTMTIGEPGVSALGRAVVVDAEGGQLRTMTSATSASHVLVTASRSQVATTAFSLSAGRIVSIDDRDGPMDTSGVYRTAITTDQARPARGSTRTVARPTFGSDIFSSGTTIVYGLPSEQDETRVVQTPNGATKLRHVAPMTQVTVSGNRVLYIGLRHDGGQKAEIFDAATGRTTHVPVSVSTIGVPSPAVFGNYVAYIKVNGSVWRENVVTGHAVRLAGPHDDMTFARVFVYGNYVGWHIEAGDDLEPPHPIDINRVRNVRTMAPSIKLPAEIAQMSGAGITLTDSEPFDPTDAKASYTLRTWSGRTVPLLPEAIYYARPQISGRTMAWIDNHNLLMVAPMPGRPKLEAPRYLGAPIAPVEVNRSGSANWRLYAPFSEPLTTCHVTISRHGQVVRTLSCKAAQSKVGVAHVGWDGTTHGTRVPAGRYTYRIFASGRGGRALDAAGNSGRPVGHIRVG
ncbi:MAG TPA: hypothetical protein VGH30_10025 [Jatrophihabitantaceae bacterium]